MQCVKINLLENKNHNSRKKRKLYINTFRVIGSLLVLYIAYTYFYADLRFKDLVQSSSTLFNSSSILPLVLIILLMPINWLFETMKWRETVFPKFNITILSAYKAVFQGVSFGIITPARVGEYGGRILYLEPENRVSGVLGTFVCSLYQNIINILMASIFLIFTGLEFVEQYNKSLLVSGGIAMCLVVVLVIWGLPHILSILTKITFIEKRIKHSSKLIDQLKKTNQVKVFSYAFFRYIVYSIQYLLIFQIFQISLSPTETFIAIGIIYGIQTILPLTPLLQLGLRGSIALFVISPIVSEENMVILASYSLWLINLLIPSIVGGILMLFKSQRLKSTS